MAKPGFPESILSNSQIKEVKKGDVLLRNGDLSDSFYVIKGCLRGFVIDKNGKEHIVQFAPEDWIISDQESILKNQPAQLNIDAIEDSTIRVIKRPPEMKMSDLDPESLVQMNEKFRNRIIALQTRIIQLISATAEERYTYFNKTYPSLAQRIPLKMIASYLGITPESLSRVRKEMVRKK